VETPAAPSRSSSSLHAWALQVGSFNEESNARVLRDRMRARGYAAYIDKQKSSSGMHYRVRIGPELDRSRIDKLREQVLKQEKIKGMVVNHP
jgi:DedD protein